MTLFNSLLHLYKKNGASATPTEDFCTECLAGILRSEDEILYDFIQQVLQIKSDSIFKVSTQKTYYTKDGKQGRVDLILESESELCFVEMKVRSGEQVGQLDTYARILREHPKLTHLRYCTLYIDEKNNLDDFYQFRWADIANFLVTKSDKNNLIREFYNFLKEKKMAGNERFNHEDLIGLKVYSDIAEKVNGVFESIESKLDKFGNVSGGINACKQITEHHRWATMCKDVLGGNWSEVLVSFDFHGVRYEDEPVVAVQLFVHTKNESYKKFCEIADKHYMNELNAGKKVFLQPNHGHGAHIRFEKPLALFFSEEPQLQKISDWVNERLDEISQFIEKHPDLPWRVKFVK